MDDVSTRRISVAERRDDARRDEMRWTGLADPLAGAATARGGRDLSRETARAEMERPAPDGPMRVWGDAVKIAFDRTAAAFGLLLLSPLLLMVAILVWLGDPGPVLYGHVRLGWGGRTFRCLKFRTMVRDGDRVLSAHLASNPEAAREWAETRKLRDDPRVTPLGRVLRRTSLDELPQLFNVLKGDMSLVGPRPIVAEEAHHYGPAIRAYLSVRPGLTGLWQVGGRSDTSYAERVRLDQAYVQRRSLTLDVIILLRTVAVVLGGRGSY